MSSPSRPLYLIIYDYLLTQISTGSWPPNSQLPSENELCKQFNVSRNTVKSAITQLVQENLVYSHQGKGSFVSPPSTEHPGSQGGADTKISVTPSRLPFKAIAYVNPSVSNSHTARLLNGIEEEAAAQGYHLIFRQTHDSRENEKEALQHLRADGIQGVIVFPAEGENFSDEILRLTLNDYPIVVIDRYLREIETNSVLTDNQEGGRLAANRLLDMGHRHIGFVSTSPWGATSIEDRLIGYERAHQESGQPVDQRYKLTNLVTESVHLEKSLNMTLGQMEAYNDRLVRSYLKLHPEITAIFAANMGIASRVMLNAQKIGKKVPEELIIVCFDEHQQNPAINQPFYISQQEELIGKEAVRLLSSIIKNPQQDRKRIHLPPKIVEPK